MSKQISKSIENSSGKRINENIEQNVTTEEKPEISSKRALELLFITACERQYYDDVTKYLAMGVDPNSKSDNLENVLNIIAERGDIIMADILCNTGRLNLNCTTSHLFTPLITAIKCRNDSFVSYLISKGANVDQPDRFGRTPLHISVHMDSIDISKSLLEGGCNRNPLDIFFNTPLSIAAAQRNYLSMLKLLIYYGADVNFYRGDMVSHVLLDVCLDCHSRKQLHIVHFLIMHGVDSNITDERTGRNGLHFAAINNFLQLVIFLEKLGTSATHRDNFGNLPFELAKKHGHFDIADLLEDYYMQQHVIDITESKAALDRSTRRLPLLLDLSSSDMSGERYRSNVPDP